MRVNEKGGTDSVVNEILSEILICCHIKWVL